MNVSVISNVAIVQRRGCCASVSMNESTIVNVVTMQRRGCRANISMYTSAMMNALAYIDASRATHLGANLIQAQRDYFGAHTFLRTDKEGSFHHEWQEHYGK